MTAIQIDRASLGLPVLSSRSRSLKSQLVAIATGGRIVRDSSDVALVEALVDINLSIHDGERVALIGHNGAGKSTLLRLISGIYVPTAGSVEVRGRVGALLEPALGIDGDATGYENIYLRGLCLGLSREQIDKNIDEISALADLGEFLHLPLRVYSNGMQARLVFCIATMVQPDILLIDEGIGMGDAAFMERADKTLQQFIARAGVLVLASHDGALLKRFCDRGIVLWRGRVIHDGTVESGLAAYYAALHALQPGHLEAT
jgi:ABC-type polysaccharide/polyol phosphate transport system ATPase subunit